MAANSVWRSVWGIVGALVVALGLAGRAAAEPPSAALFALEPGATEAGPRLAELLLQLEKREGITLESVSAPAREGGAHESDRRELSVLGDVERALREARELSAELHEAAALRVLADAEQALLGALDLPGVHAFLAEVYTQVALCAAQLDENGLFESSLQRALSLDPNRRIEAPEAPPAIVERARALALAQDLAPISEGQIEPDPGGANAWLDGVPLNSGGLAFRARAGMHVLVVRAAGYAPYAALVQLAPGKRPALRVALSMRPDHAARLALQTAHDAAQREDRARGLAAARGTAIYLLSLGGDPVTRMLVQRCTREACAQPMGLDVEGHERAGFADARAARAWLNATVRDARAPRLAREDEPVSKRASPRASQMWKRWPLWTGAAALVLASVVTAVLVTREPAQRPERSLEIDASALPR